MGLRPSVYRGGTAAWRAVGTVLLSDLILLVLITWVLPVLHLETQVGDVVALITLAVALAVAPAIAAYWWEMRDHGRDTSDLLRMAVVLAAVPFGLALVAIFAGFVAAPRLAGGWIAVSLANLPILATVLVVAWCMLVIPPMCGAMLARFRLGADSSGNA